jgi:arginine deiminase
MPVVLVPGSPPHRRERNVSVEVVPWTAPRVGVDSDVDVLERVLVHRPGSELARVTDDSADALLFDGGVSIRQAQLEHERLVSALRDAGAEVIHLEAALASLLCDGGVRNALTERLCVRHAAARRWLMELPAPRLARVLVAGLAAEELPAAGQASLRTMRRSGSWLVRPLPNLMFPRDVVSIVGRGAVRGTMRTDARRPEEVLMEVLLGQDPHMRRLQCWSSGDLDVEGGDVLPIGDGVVVIGIGQRTSLRAARTLARRLLAGGGAREVVGALIPPGGPFHLDLAVTMVDRDTFLIDRPVVDAITTVRWQLHERACPGGGFIGALRAALDGGPLTVIEALAGDHGRGWDRGTNVVAVRPGTVIAYADNRATNRRLERAGIDVWPVAGRELGKGRGGPRCLTAPLARTPLEVS